MLLTNEGRYRKSVNYGTRHTQEPERPLEFSDPAPQGIDWMQHERPDS
jgi:hypothetical protein